MLQTSLESLGAFVFDLIMVGTCYNIAWRMRWVIVVGMIAHGDARYSHGLSVR